MTRTSTVDTRIIACGLAACRSINVLAASTTRSQHHSIVRLGINELRAFGTGHGRVVQVRLGCHSRLAAGAALGARQAGDRHSRRAGLKVSGQRSNRFSIGALPVRAEVRTAG
jgi:hypothetical protein